MDTGVIGNREQVLGSEIQAQSVHGTRHGNGVSQRCVVKPDKPRVFHVRAVYDSFCNGRIVVLGLDDIVVVYRSRLQVLIESTVAVQQVVPKRTPEEYVEVPVA